MPQNLCFDIGIFSLKTKQVTTCELESKQPKVGCRLWLRSSSFSVFRQEIEKDRKTYITYVQKYLSWRGLAERTRYKSTTTFRCIYVNICLFIFYSVSPESLWRKLEFGENSTGKYSEKILLLLTERSPFLVSWHAWLFAVNKGIFLRISLLFLGLLFWRLQKLRNHM